MTGVFCNPKQLDAGVAGLGAACDNHLIPGDIPARGRDRGGGCRGGVGHTEDAMRNVAQVPHLG